VIEDHAMSGFAVVMPQDIYKIHIKRKIPPEMDSPYFHCFLGLVELTSKVILSMGFDVTVDFIFDKQGIERRARPMFDGFKEWTWKGSAIVKHLDWRDDTEELPLQAADFLAWRIRRRLSEALPNHKQMSWMDKPSAFVHVFDEKDVVRFMRLFQTELARILNSKREP
jgi:hypothetical protein